MQIRLLALWDKGNEIQTLVFATHAFIKKVDKVPANEIKRAINIRRKYFESKNKKWHHGKDSNKIMLAWRNER